jgi:hypothetical protein
MHARLDKVVGEAAEHIGLDAAGRIDRRDEIGKHAMEVGHEASRFVMLRYILWPGSDVAAKELFEFDRAREKDQCVQSVS